MHGFEEMLGAQPYLHILSDAVVDHQRAQQGGFRLDIARQAFFRRVLRGNQSYILGHVLSSAHCAKETRGTLLYAVDKPVDKSRSEEHTSELQSLMSISYAVFCL